MADRQSIAAAAGPLGDDVRSDVHVAYDPGNQPLDIQITSKVDYLYGEAVHSAVLRVVDAFCVTTGRLAVTDMGALEWVLMARVEACLLAAGFEGGPVLPEPAPGAASPPVRKVEDPDQVRRAGVIAREGAGNDHAPLLMPILESPVGIHRAFEIATADELVAALTLGLEDLSARQSVNILVQVLEGST